MRSDYRIIIKTSKSGNKYFYIQKRFLWFFWAYIKEIQDMTMAKYRVEYGSLEQAIICIDNLIAWTKGSDSCKIVKTEIYKP